MPNTKRSKISKKNNKEGIFNFNEQVENKNTKKTKTSKVNQKGNKLYDEYFIGTKELPSVNKKKLQKIKKEKLKEKKTKEKEIIKEQRKQEKARKKRVQLKQKHKLTEKQIKRNKRIKLVIKLFLLLAVITGIIIYLMLSPVFNIKNIKVEGNSQITSEQIISLSKIQKDINLFSVSNKDTISSIKENPYIKTVKVKRTLPDTITLVITERTTRFILEYGSSYAYIDNQGYILEISANIKEGLPKIIGYKTSQEEIIPGNRLIEEDLEKLNNVLKITSVAKNNLIDGLITTINIQDENNYSLYLEQEQKTVYLGDCSSLDTKMTYVKVILEKEKGHAGEIFVNMDLNEKNPYFREKV